MTPRRFSAFLLAALLCQGIGSAQGQMTAEYKPVSLQDLTRIAIDNQAVDLKNAKAFEEYLKIMDCNTYTQIKDSQFKQQELQHATLQRLAQMKNHEKSGDLFVSIPTTFLTSGYNFDTQSLDIIPENQLKRVNVMTLYDQRTPICSTAVNTFERFPSFYRVQLNTPVSLYRIPLQKNLAETVMLKLDQSRIRQNDRIIYGNVLVRIESIQPKVASSTLNKQALGMVHGQVTAIDLFIDHEHKIRFKRLGYLDAF